MKPEHLVEIEAIKQLKARYFRLMDTKQWESWAHVFSEDARLRWGPSEDEIAEGRDAIVRAVRGHLEQAVSCHQGYMPEIELRDDGSATGIWAMSDLIDHPDFLLRGFGHYHEEYVKRDGRWQIRSLVLTRLRQETDPK